VKRQIVKTEAVSVLLQQCNRVEFVAGLCFFAFGGKRRTAVVLKVLFHLSCLSIIKHACHKNL
jgi:hypothetical protein